MDAQTIAAYDAPAARHAAFQRAVSLHRFAAALFHPDALPPLT
jgi:hypothetical protein